MESFEKIIWSDDLSMNDYEIDNQHKKLISMINDLIEKDKHGLIHKVSFAGILSELTDYSLQHFKDEEAFLKKLEYPFLAELHQQHEEFILKVALFNFDLLNKNPSVQHEVLAFLKDWWYTHITTADMKYRDYLLRNNR